MTYCALRAGSWIFCPYTFFKPTRRRTCMGPHMWTPPLYSQRWGLSGVCNEMCLNLYAPLYIHLTNLMSLRMVVPHTVSLLLQLYALSNELVLSLPSMSFFCSYMIFGLMLNSCLKSSMFMLSIREG